MSRHLRCSCCGSDAGSWQQFHNQDHGFGICAPCVAWIKSRNRPETDIPRTYGVEGLNFAPPSAHELHAEGRRKSDRPCSAGDGRCLNCGFGEEVRP